MTRYIIMVDGDSLSQVNPASHGPWVKFEEVEPALTEAARLIQEADPLTNGLDWQVRRQAWLDQYRKG